LQVVKNFLAVLTSFSRFSGQGLAIVNLLTDILTQRSAVSQLLKHLKHVRQLSVNMLHDVRETVTHILTNVVKGAAVNDLLDNTTSFFNRGRHVFYCMISEEKLT
jgi:hypothetical protein